MVAGAEHATSPRRGRYAGLLLASKGCFLQIRIRGALARLERLEVERLRLLDALVMACGVVDPSSQSRCIRIRAVSSLDMTVRTSYATTT